MSTFPNEAGAYQLVAPVAYGIWEAQCATNQQRVAIKMIDCNAPRVVDSKKYIERLVSAPLLHENLTQIFACFVREQYMWVVIALAEVGSVKLLLLTDPVDGGFDGPTCCGVMAQVARGLAYLHEQQYLHRDICAANFLVERSGRVRLSGNYTLPSSETSRDMVGTLTHAAPEVVWGTDYTAECDLWSLGISFLELLGGEAPHADLTPPLRIVQAIVHGAQPELSPQARASLAGSPLPGLIESLLSKDALKRPSAADVVSQLPPGGVQAVDAFLRSHDVKNATESFPLVYPDLENEQLPPYLYPPQDPNGKLPRSQVLAAIADAKKKTRRVSVQHDGNPVVEEAETIERKASVSEKRVGKFTVTTTAPPPQVVVKSGDSSSTVQQQGKFTVTTTTRSAAAECDESSAFEMRSFLESMVAEQRAQRELIQEVLATCKRTAEEMKVLQSSYRLLKKESDGVREENQKLRAQLTGHSLNQ